MKRSRYLLILLLFLLTAVVIIAIGALIKHSEPTVLQGVVQCRQYRVSSKIPGRIEHIYITEGERVDSGALLYTLSTPELNTKLTQATAAKSAAQALDRQALAGARKQQIEAAYNLYQRATAARNLAEKSYNRVARLYEKGVVTAQQLDEASANFEASKAAQSAAYAEYSLALAGATKEQKAAAAAQVEMAQGAVAEVESYIADSHLFAPISGEISTVAYYAGELVGTGFPVVTILDTSNIWVEFNIKESLMPQIAIGNIFRAYIPAIDRDITLIVSYISPQADFATWSATRAEGSYDIRTFAVRMREETEDESALRQGMSAIIKL